jgi:hypothetical protein
MNKNNLERLQDFQKKKTQELAMMEEERRKAQEKREKLRQIVYQFNYNIIIGLQKS